MQLSVRDLFLGCRWPPVYTALWPFLSAHVETERSERWGCSEREREECMCSQVSSYKNTEVFVYVCMCKCAQSDEWLWDQGLNIFGKNFKYIWFTILCSLLVYSKVIQLCKYFQIILHYSCCKVLNGCMHSRIDTKFFCFIYCSL